MLFGKTQTFHHGAGQPLAAPAGEGEGVQHDGTDLFIELPAHEGAGAMQSGFACSQRGWRCHLHGQLQLYLV